MGMVSEKQVLDMQAGENNEMSVAIWMVTYNHEKYIEQSIESIMTQITKFKFKLFIGEDCSTDKTRKKCVLLKEKYPDKIDLILNNQNVGGLLNAENIYKLCFKSGAKYIALLEGDDYWTDSLKLQKQVDFLEQNPDYVLTFHGLSYLDGRDFKIKPSLNKFIFNKIDLVANGCFINTPTVMFRNVLMKDVFDNYFSKLSTGDYALFLLLADYGKIQYMEDNMAVYRLHSGGTWSTQNDLNMYIKIAQNLRIFVEHENDIDFKREFINQNRSNFKYLLFDLLTNSDWIKIDVIREVSSFDSMFDSFFINEIVRKHIELHESSRLKKVQKWVNKYIK